MGNRQAFVGAVLRPSKSKTSHRSLSSLGSPRSSVLCCGWTAESFFGYASTGLQRLADAEPLLVDGYEGLKIRESAIHVTARFHVSSALDRVIQLYDDWGKPDQVAEWRKKRQSISQQHLSRKFANSVGESPTAFRTKSRKRAFAASASHRGADTSDQAESPDGVLSTHLREVWRGQWPKKRTSVPS
jgi:hypothetical protein